MRDMLVSLCTIACLTGTTVEARRYVDEEVALRTEPRSYTSCSAGGVRLILSETPDGVSYEYRQLSHSGRESRVIDTGVITDFAWDILIQILDQANSVLRLHIHSSGVTFLMRKTEDQVYITAADVPWLSCQYH